MLQISLFLSALATHYLVPWSVFYFVFTPITNLILHYSGEESTIHKSITVIALIQIAAFVVSSLLAFALLLSKSFIAFAAN